VLEIEIDENIKGLKFTHSPLEFNMKINLLTFYSMMK